MTQNTVSISNTKSLRDHPSTSVFFRGRGLKFAKIAEGKHQKTGDVKGVGIKI